ncbi:MAG: lactate utilization protein [Legionellaceae bacterium]|nr:lactate utilization protein [Legionellaceae bacterium]
MNENVSNDESIKQTLSALKANGYLVYFSENKKQALNILQSLLGNQEQTIGLGGSVTVEEVGVMNFILNEPNFHVFNQYEPGITFEENNLRRKRGLLADTFITGTNSITMNGQLVNADGSGNRIAGMVFGPKRVILMAGINKIVPSVESAFDRIHTIAAVKNMDRVNKKAASLFKDRQYTVKTIANYYNIMERCAEENRITIILINQILGF